MHAINPATLLRSICPLFRAAADHVRVYAVSTPSVEERDHVWPTPSKRRGASVRSGGSGRCLRPTGSPQNNSPAGSPMS